MRRAKHSETVGSGDTPAIAGRTPVAAGELCGCQALNPPVSDRQDSVNLRVCQGASVGKQIPRKANPSESKSLGSACPSQGNPRPHGASGAPKQP